VVVEPDFLLVVVGEHVVMSAEEYAATDSSPAATAAATGANHGADPSSTDPTRIIARASARVTPATLCSNPSGVRAPAR
jgi:hypothetical protein